MNKIQKRSKLFRRLFQGLFWLVPAITAIRWGSPHHFAQNIWMPDGSHFIQLTALTQFLGFLINMIPASVAMYAAYQLIKLFKNYEQGSVFSLENAKHYQKLGYALIIFVFFRIVSEVAIGKMLQITAHPTHLGFSFGFYPSDLTAIIAGAIIVLISWVMREAFQLSQDHAEII